MRDISSRRNYEELCIIGRGAYGTVFKAKDTENDRMVALKRVRIVNNTEEKGVPVSTLREITLLKQLDNMSHPNIVRMFDAFQTFSTTPTDSPQDLILTIVFEHVEQDLSTFLHNSPPHGLQKEVIKDLMYQLLSGIDYLHTNRMIHRDIKPQNILISKNKQVKIADFGLARVYGFCKLVTSVVVTLWYRAPEILLHAPYATMVDLWSVGTIMAEMYNRRPLFCGKSDVNQLHKILSVIGSPDPSEWPENVSLPWDSFSKYPKIDLLHLIPNMCSQGIDLLNKMLTFDPDKRYNAQACLLHPYFEDIDYPDSQDSGVYAADTKSIHKNAASKDYSEYIKNHTNTDLRLEVDECGVISPCPQLKSDEDGSSRSRDSGLENIPKQKECTDMEKLNASFHDASFHETCTQSEDTNTNIFETPKTSKNKTLASANRSSMSDGMLTSENRTFASEAITLAIESKGSSGECSRTLTRSDSGIGNSPQPHSSYSENCESQEFCSRSKTQSIYTPNDVCTHSKSLSVYSERDEVYMHGESQDIHAHSETQDVFTRSEKTEVYTHVEKAEVYTHVEKAEVYTHVEKAEVYTHSNACTESNSACSHTHKRNKANVLPEKNVHTASGKIRTSEEVFAGVHEYDKEHPLYPPAKRFRGDGTQA